MDITVPIFILMLLILFIAVSFFSKKKEENINDKTITVGMILIGPSNDQGWNQSHYEGLKYAVNEIDNIEAIIKDRILNSDSDPNIVENTLNDLINSGCNIIIATSEEYQKTIIEYSQKYPQINFLQMAGTYYNTNNDLGIDITNLSNITNKDNITGNIAGFMAGLITRTGKIGFIGPFKSIENNRIVSSVYLGAKYAWTHIRKKNIKDLIFKQELIGFWNFIIGETKDPIDLTNKLINDDYDIIINSLDGIDSLRSVLINNVNGNNIKSIQYNYKPICSELCSNSPEDCSSCSGVFYQNWRTSYLNYLNKVKNSEINPQKNIWEWLSPDLKSLENLNSVNSPTGFLPTSNKYNKILNEYINKINTGEIEIYEGPLYLQDDTLYIKKNAIATEEQIWNFPLPIKGVI